LKYDPRSDYLFVAGGMTCKAFVYSGTTGETIAEITLTDGPCFINDVVITQDAAYFTNSFLPEIYKVSLEEPFTSVTIPLGGDYEFVEGGFNANGIDATPNGKMLIIVNSTTGKLYLVDPTTGVATLIDLGDDNVTNGDGILLVGKTLYVVQNAFNQIAVIKLAPDYTSGELTSTITNDNFDVPTTIAKFGNALYAVNARFGTSVTPDTEYTVVRVPLH
jgi:sugar lactone lactonase YvrE